MILFLSFFGRLPLLLPEWYYLIVVTFSPFLSAQPLVFCTVNEGPVSLKPLPTNDRNIWVKESTLYIYCYNLSHYLWERLTVCDMFVVNNRCVDLGNIWQCAICLTSIVIGVWISLVPLFGNGIPFTQSWRWCSDPV